MRTGARAVAILMLAILSFFTLCTRAVAADPDSLDRVIPLPQKIHVERGILLPPDRVRLVVPDQPHPLLKTAVALLQPFANGRTGDFAIRLNLIADPKEPCPAAIRDSLAALPSRDQAYAIEPVIENGEFCGLRLAASTPLGLLYAARTLSRLLESPLSGKNGTEYPRISILDWPDMEERGLWGGDCSKDLAWMAERKLNLIEIHATLGFDEAGNPTGSLDEKMVAEARSVGIKVVPIILHLEQLAGTGLFRFHPEVASLPDPKKPLPTDYEPGVCFSRPETVRLLAGWMDRLLAIPDIDEVMVWLSEMESGCHCPDCAGKEPFVMETRGITRAFEKARRNKPSARLRILTTQASYPVNDQVLAATNPEIRISYYDGGRTYDSSHKPMIYPLMETFARSGRWLGVYPQFTASWRTVFPFSGADFIRTRMREFAEKKLRCVAGYATPSDRYYEFNITAAAEWGWNRNGRTVAGFARAYARQIEETKPAAFSRWAERIGPPGWNLAGSRVFESLIFNPDLPLTLKEPMAFGKGMLAEYPDRQALVQNIKDAETALELAEKSGNREMKLESESVLETLRLLDSLQSFSVLKEKTEFPRDFLERLLNRIDRSARRLTRSLYHWGMAVNPRPRSELPSRFRDSVDIAAKIAHAARQIGNQNRVPDPNPDYRPRLIGEWNAGDFAGREKAVLWADVSGNLREAGEYDVTFQFEDGAAGVYTQCVSLLRGPDPASAKEIDRDQWKFRVGRFDRWIDYWITLTGQAKQSEKKGDRYFLKMEVDGPSPSLPPERRTTRGRILIRRSWRS
jgi:hypothetical protein